MYNVNYLNTSCIPRVNIVIDDIAGQTANSMNDIVCGDFSHFAILSPAENPGLFELYPLRVGTVRRSLSS